MIADKKIMSIYELNQKGYKKVEIAERLAVSRATVTRVLSGKQRVDLMPLDFVPKRNLTRTADVAKIENMKLYRYKMGYTLKQIANIYNESEASISIKTRA